MNIKDLKGAYKQFQTIGIGLTNKCNLNCAHCYSRKMTSGVCAVADAKKIIKLFPNLKSVNFGTGESILNPDFNKIVDLFHSKKIKMAITSNGLSIQKMSLDQLKRFEDVDVSLDFPTGEMHDKWRGVPGIFDNAIKVIEKCKQTGVNVSLAVALMATNYKYLKDFKPLLDKYDIFLRINLYKPVNSDQFSLSYNQFWQAMKDLGGNFEIVSCSEPVLALLWPEVKGGSKCGNSLRIHPDGEIAACVYVKGRGEPEEFNEEKRLIPEFCQDCEVKERCRGGCFGRRILENRKSLPDSYCPFYNKKKLPKITFRKYNKGGELIHSNYLCTLIIR